MKMLVAMMQTLFQRIGRKGKNRDMKAIKHIIFGVLCLVVFAGIYCLSLKLYRNNPLSLYDRFWYQKITLGMNKDQLEQILGEPIDEIRTNTYRYRNVDVSYQTEDNKNIAIEFSIEIKVHENRFCTNKGISLSKDVSDVENAYSRQLINMRLGEIYKFNFIILPGNDKKEIKYDGDLEQLPDHYYEMIIRTGDGNLWTYLVESIQLFDRVS